MDFSRLNLSAANMKTELDLSYSEFFVHFWDWNKTVKKEKRFHQKLPWTICTSLWYTKPNGLFISLLKRPPKIDPTGDILIKRPKPELTQTKESFNSSNFWDEASRKP